MHLHSCKLAYYNKYFKSGQNIVMGKNPFYIYWVCKLFEECRPNDSYKQRDMLKGLSNNYLWWGRLSQINEFVPHHGYFCYHCKIYEDCKQILIERGKLQDPGDKEEGYYFNSLEVYVTFLDRKKEIRKEYKL